MDGARTDSVDAGAFVQKRADGVACLAQGGGVDPGAGQVHEGGLVIEDLDPGGGKQLLRRGGELIDIRLGERALIDEEVQANAAARLGRRGLGVQRHRDGLVQRSAGGGLAANEQTVKARCELAVGVVRVHPVDQAWQLASEIGLDGGALHEVDARGVDELGHGVTARAAAHLEQDGFGAGGGLELDLLGETTADLGLDVDDTDVVAARTGVFLAGDHTEAAGADKGSQGRRARHGLQHHAPQSQTSTPHVVPGLHFASTSLSSWQKRTVLPTQIPS